MNDLDALLALAAIRTPAQHKWVETSNWDRLTKKEQQKKLRDRANAKSAFKARRMKRKKTR